jgi:hypothetical protein
MNFTKQLCKRCQLTIIPIYPEKYFIFLLILLQFLYFVFIFVVLGIYCDIYEISYNVSQLNSPLPSFPFIPLPTFLE